MVQNLFPVNSVLELLLCFGKQMMEERARELLGTFPLDYGIWFNFLS